MKRLFVILLALCLVFAGALTWVGMKNSDQTPSDTTPVEPPLPAETEPAGDVTGALTDDVTDMDGLPEVKLLDREALMALHEPDEVIAVVDGQEITWDLYAYWLVGNASSVEYYMTMMSYYGESVDWNDPWDTESDESFLDYVPLATEEYIKQVAVIEAYAKANGVVLSEEIEAEIAAALEEDKLSNCGEDATDEDYRAFLLENSMTPELYERMLRVNYLFQEAFSQLYGANGEKLSDEETLAYLEAEDYLAANHILVTELEEAEALSAELQEIADPEALLARFAALKAEKDEDPGKVDFPDGYVFTAGEMVPAFEEAARALALYEVSDPVESDYGYHVILRVPLSPDAVIDYDMTTGEELSARSIAADMLFAERLDRQMESATIEFAPDFELPDLASLLV